MAATRRYGHEVDRLLTHELVGARLVATDDRVVPVGEVGEVLSVENHDGHRRSVYSSKSCGICYLEHNILTDMPSGFAVAP